MVEQRAKRAISRDHRHAGNERIEVEGLDTWDPEKTRELNAEMDRAGCVFGHLYHPEELDRIENEASR